MVRPRILHSVLLLLAVAAIAPRPASADTPMPHTSTIDPVVVGGSSSIPIAVGGDCATRPPGFHIIVRDLAQVPVEGASVTLDFSLTPIRLYATQYDGTTVNCLQRTLTRISGAQGAVTFYPVFGGSDATNSVEVSADGVVLAFVPARSTDIDAMDATTGLGDFTIFSSAFAQSLANTRTNFDNCPVGASIPTIADFAIFVRQFETGATGTYCP